MKGRNDNQNIAMERDGYYSVPDVARRCQISAQAIHNWISRGKIVPRSIGRRRYISKADVCKILGPDAVKLFKLDKSEIVATVK
jgi:hypothetical protein